MSQNFRIGIDLGGTKIEGMAMNGAGEVRARHRVPTPAGDYTGTVSAIVDLVRLLENDIGTQATVGIGMPGAISHKTGLVKNANSICLIGRPLAHDLSEALGRLVKLENDANCFALSEAVDGAGKGYETVFGVILGTGVGGGVVHSARVLTGANAIAGEWGHNPLPSPTEPGELPGPVCYCGRNGCIETFLSGPGLAADHLRHSGQDCSTREIVSMAFHGNKDCLATLERYADRLARGLASVVNLLDPDVIVLGGGLSEIEFLYRRVPELWSRYIFSDQINTRLLPPVHGAASGVRGAAWLWPPD